MIAFDLDRTLIFSERYLRDWMQNTEEDIEFHLIEDGEWNSYISSEVIHGLKKLMEVETVIPVTTRTTDEYYRLNFEKYGIFFSSWITSNGGRIFINGEEDYAWKKSVELSVTDLSILEGIAKKLRKEQILLNFQMADSIFLCGKMGGELPSINIPSQYSMYIQNTKLYILPNNILKISALNYVGNILGETLNVAAGDSIFDCGMISQAKEGYLFLFKDRPFNLPDSLNVQRVYNGGPKSTNELISMSVQKYCFKEVFNNS